MVVKRIWMEEEIGLFTNRWKREGWYLFGFIPLYIRDIAPRGCKEKGG